MEDKLKFGNAIMEKVDSFLTKNKIWVSWIYHVVLIGVLFGIFYLATYLLSITWWIGVIILIITGIIWGSIKYANLRGKFKKAE